MNSSQNHFLLANAPAISLTSKDNGALTITSARTEIFSLMHITAMIKNFPKGRQRTIRKL